MVISMSKAHKKNTKAVKNIVDQAVYWQIKGKQLYEISPGTNPLSQEVEWKNNSYIVNLKIRKRRLINIVAENILEDMTRLNLQQITKIECFIKHEKGTNCTRDENTSKHMETHLSKYQKYY